MATWQDISVDSRRAAQDLLDGGRWRSSISRSYYAAYAAVTAELVARNVTFPNGRRNPEHRALPTYIDHNLTSLPAWARRQLSHSIRRLRAERVDADYMPAASIGRGVALAALRDANRVLVALGINQ